MPNTTTTGGTMQEQNSGGADAVVEQVQSQAQGADAAQAEAPQAEAPAKSKRQRAQSSQPEAPLHPNPRIAKALAEHRRQGDKYKSAAELCRSVGINDKATQRAVRQIMRDAGQGVGRGRTYSNITTPKVVRAAQANGKRVANAAKAAKKGAKK